MRASAAIASAAAAERGGVEGEAILRAVVGRGSAPMGSACSFSSRGAHLQPETARGTRVWWSWVALEPGVNRGSAHQRAARASLPGGRAEPWGRGGPRGGSAAAETDLSLDHPAWTTLNEPPQVGHPERPIPKTAPLNPVGSAGAGQSEGAPRGSHALSIPRRRLARPWLHLASCLTARRHLGACRETMFQLRACTPRLENWCRTE